MAEETKEPKKMKCPCCGELTITQPLDVKGVTLDEFMSSIIAGVPYTHTYKMFSGTVEITVEVVSKQLANMRTAAIKLLEGYVAKMEASGEAQAAAAAAPIRELISVMHLYFGVKTITMYKNDRVVKQYTPADLMQEAAAMITKTSMESQDAFESAVAKYLEKCVSTDTISALPTEAIRTVVVTHADIYTLLLTAGFDENFWEGIELA